MRLLTALLTVFICAASANGARLASVCADVLTPPDSLAYTDRLRFEQARGVVAAIFMRTAIFLSLFIAINAGREHRP